MTEQWAASLWQRFKDMYGQKWTTLFQGPEAISSWRILWATLDVTGDQIRYAMGRLPDEFAEWPPTFGQFKALCGNAPKPALPSPKIERGTASPESVAAFKKALAESGFGNYWTPERIANHAATWRKSRHE